MREYILKQLLTAVPTLLGVSIAVFLMLHLTPGGAVEAIVLQGGAAISAETMAKMREDLGFNDPLHVQYWRFFSKAIRGDFGRSYRTHQSVTSMILKALPGTAQLAVTGLAIALVLGLSMGVISALWHNTWIDNACMVVAMLGWSIPQFWLGILFILIFAVHLGWLPITGQGGPGRLVLPAFTLGLSTAGVTARMVRTGMLEILRMDYVRTARAKGLHESVVVLRHVLRNALIPVVTVVGLQFGRLLGGTVVIETVFARQGVGRVALQALLARDMPTVQGTVLFLAVIYVVINILVDFSYAFLDPRIRYV